MRACQNDSTIFSELTVANESSVASANSKWAGYADQLAQQAQTASRALVQISGERKQKWLHLAADRLVQQQAFLIGENERDLAKAPEYGLSSAAIDRLRLSATGIEKLATALREIAALPDPIGEVIEGYNRPNGLRVLKTRVPLGVVFFIYESRPNVTIDAAALCVKSGNAVILRGGKEALFSNLALYRVLQESLRAAELPPQAVQLVEQTDREIVGELLRQRNRIDLTIPRGGKSLIERVAAEATMPVLKHYDGVCHVYVDASADLAMAVKILQNAKCQRPGVCNAAECVLVHADIAQEFFRLAEPMFAEQNVLVRGCELTCSMLAGASLATPEDYGTEYLDLILSAKVVRSFEEAVEHISRYGSKHTDAIITKDVGSADRFVQQIDSAAVVVNASTRFNDGGELGLGAEIGISTDKFHARGPCGLRELTSYKWIIRGEGQIR